MILYMNLEIFISLFYLTRSDLLCVLISLFGSLVSVSELPISLLHVLAFEQERLDGIVCAYDTRLESIVLVSCSPFTPSLPPLCSTSLLVSRVWA